MSIHKDLLNAFEQRNLGKFQEALEVFQADPNHYVKARDQTIFEIILSAPSSSAYIKLCIENGADFYMVSEPTLEQLSYLPAGIVLHCFVHTCRPTTTRSIHCIAS